MHKSSLLTLSLVMGSFFSLSVFAEDIASKNVDIKGSYVRATVPGQTMSSAYFYLLNNDKKDHALVSITSPMAQQVQIHVSLEEAGVAKMRRINEVALGSHRQAVLEPGGMHVMLIGLNKGLKLGDSVPLTLAFEDGSSKTINMPVRGLISESSAPLPIEAQHLHG